MPPQMANIPKLPSGVAIATTLPPGKVLPYGPHLTVKVEGSTASLAKLADGTKLVLVSANGTVHGVNLAELDDITVQYANRFLEETGRSILKDWRTKEYRLKGGKRRAKRNRAVATTHTAPPKVEQPTMQKPLITEGEAKGAVITVSGDNTKRSNIPGMLFLPPVALKGAGRGWVDLDGILLPKEQFTSMLDAWHLAQDGDQASFLLTGAAGTAKTQVVRAFAAYLGVGYLKVDAGAVRTADDWSGAFRQDPNTKTWAHRWSPFAQALRAGQPCIIHVDELTRTETPAALNAFMGLLDETGTLAVPDANDILTMPKGILVMATANIGPEFVGTLPIDGAVRRRFPYGNRMAAPPEAVEIKVLTSRTGVDEPTAQALVRMANGQRQHRDDAQQYPSGGIINTALLLSIAKRIVKRSTPAREAVWSVLHAQFDPGDDKALSLLVDAQFPKRPVPTAPAAGTDASIKVGRHWFSGDASNALAGCLHEYPDGLQCLLVKSDPIHYGNK